MQPDQRPQHTTPINWYGTNVPKRSGTKLDSRWLGPCKVVRRVGEHSYEILVDEELVKDAPAIFLKKYKPDFFNSNPRELYFHKRTVVDRETTPQEWVVDKILDHKVDSQGRYKFLTHWEGADEKDATWEPVNHFIHRYNSNWVKYCQEKGLSMDLIPSLSARPMHD